MVHGRRQGKRSCKGWRWKGMQESRAVKREFSQSFSWSLGRYAPCASRLVYSDSNSVGIHGDQTSPVCGCDLVLVERIVAWSPSLWQLCILCIRLIAACRVEACQANFLSRVLCPALNH